MQKCITHVLIKGDEVLITLRNVPAKTEYIHKIFELLSAGGLCIDMVCQSMPLSELTDLSFTVGSEGVLRLLETVTAIKRELPAVKTDVNTRNTKLSFSGSGMQTERGVVSAVLAMLVRLGADIRLISTSETVISVLVDACHQEAIEEELAKYGWINIEYED